MMSKEDINAQFLAAVKMLIQLGVVKTEKQILEDINANKSIISRIKKGNRSITVEHLYSFITFYKLNAHYFFYNETKLFLDKKTDHKISKKVTRSVNAPITEISGLSNQQIKIAAINKISEPTQDIINELIKKNKEFKKLGKQHKKEAALYKKRNDALELISKKQNKELHLLKDQLINKLSPSKGFNAVK